MKREKDYELSLIKELLKMHLSEMGTCITCPFEKECCTAGMEFCVLLMDCEREEN